MIDDFWRCCSLTARVSASDVSPNPTNCPIGGDRQLEAPALQAPTPMTCRQWSGFVVVGSVIVLSATPGCARKLARGLPRVESAAPVITPGISRGAPDQALTGAPRRTQGKGDGIRLSQKSNNAKAPTTSQEPVDRGVPTSTSGSGAAGPNWSVVVSTPPPALNEDGGGAAASAATVLSTSSSLRHPVRSGLGLAAALTIAFALIAAIVVAPKFLNKTRSY